MSIMKENQITENWSPARYIRENETVLDFSGLYEVSDMGRVRSLNYNHTGKVKVLCQCTNKGKDGTIRHTVWLCKDRKQYNLNVHRLVLSSFRPKGHRDGYFSGAVVNHKIERTAVSCINELSNLEWISQRQNNSTEHCREARSKAHTNHPSLSKRVKVTDLTTGEVAEYPSAHEAGRALGINPNVPAGCIKCYKGYYKKLNLHFMYV